MFIQVGNVNENQCTFKCAKIMEELFTSPETTAVSYVFSFAQTEQAKLSKYLLNLFFIYYCLFQACTLLICFRLMLKKAVVLKKTDLNQDK